MSSLEMSLMASLDLYKGQVSC